MNKLIYYTSLVVALLFGLSLCAQTNVYHPMPTEKAVWRTDFYSAYGSDCCCEGSGPCFEKDDFQIYTNGDTVIGGETYTKLYRVGQQVKYKNSPTNCPPGCNQLYEYYNDGLVGLFRNDSANKKVYFRYPNDFEEQLFYDFDLVIGDTLPETINGFPESNFVVGIDSVQVKGAYHKRFQIASYNSGNTPYVYLIEGVGSDFGLLSLITEYPEHDYGFMLQCLRVNDSVVFQNTGECKLITGVESVSVDQKISIYPNPTSNKFQLEVPKGILPAVVRITDALGKLIAVQEITHPNTTISTLDTEPGIYQVVVISIASQETKTSSLLVR